MKPLYQTKVGPVLFRLLGLSQAWAAANRNQARLEAQLLGARDALEADRRSSKMPAELARAVPAQLPDWEPDDAAAWRAFLESRPGQRLRAQLAFWEATANRSAVLRRDGFENNCGYARGFFRCAEWLLEKLSAHVPPQEDVNDTEDSTGAAAGGDPCAPVNTVKHG